MASATAFQLCVCCAFEVSPRFLLVQGVDVILASDGSGEGRGGEQQKDVLPPLVPGMKARQQR